MGVMGGLPVRVEVALAELSDHGAVDLQRFVEPGVLVLTYSRSV